MSLVNIYLFLNFTKMLIKKNKTEIKLEVNDIVPSPTTEEQIRERLHHISSWELEFCPNIPWTSVEELLNNSVPPKQSSELNQPQWMVTMAYG